MPQPQKGRAQLWPKFIINCYLSTPNKERLWSCGLFFKPLCFRNDLLVTKKSLSMSTRSEKKKQRMKQVNLHLLITAFTVTCWAGTMHFLHCKFTSMTGERTLRPSTNFPVTFQMCAQGVRDQKWQPYLTSNFNFYVSFLVILHSRLPLNIHKIKLTTCRWPEVKLTIFMIHLPYHLSLSQGLTAIFSNF